MFNPVQICFNFLDQVLVLVYFDFRDSTKECSILVNPVHICFAFSTKFWCIPTFSTQQKMFDFVRPSSDMFQLSRPSFAFGVFRLSRLNKECSIFFDSVQICFAFSTKYWYIPVSRPNKKCSISFHPVLICFDFLDQNMINFDFLDPIKKCSSLFDPVQICFNFLDQILVYFDFLDSTKNVRFCSTQYR